MKLQELSERSETPVSSVKYYLREGLLEQGVKRNATTATYDESHVERLVLIHTLRHVVGLPIERVREVVDVVRSGDPVTLMGVVQSAVLGLPSAARAAAQAPSGPSSADPSAGDAEAASSRGAEPDAGDSPLIAAQVVDAMGWARGADDATAALDQELRVIAGWGIRSDLETLLVYARAADAVARYEQQLPEGNIGAGGGAPSPDRLATFVARGVYAGSRLLLGLLAVAQGSLAIERRERLGRAG